MGASIEDLLDLRFFNRKIEHRMIIALEGQPRPVIRTSIPSGKEFNCAIEIEYFNPKIYEQVYWLTGCATYQRLYCWPCLLFRERDSQWNAKFMNQAFLLDQIADHEKTAYHAEAELKFRTFLQSFTSKNSIAIKANSNRNFYKVFCINQETLKLLIEAACTVVTENKPYRRHTDSPTQINPSSCMEVICKLRRRKNTRFQYCDNAIDLLQTCPTLLNDLVDSITMVVRSAVKTEVQMSTYVSLILGSHCTSSTKSQLYVVLRYITKGKVQERFLGFLNISGCKRVNTIDDIISRTIEEFQISEKFLSYSFDGSVLELSELTDLNNLLRDKYPKSYFVPCYFQGILHTFQRSLTVHKGLTEFFEILYAMEDCFKKDAELRKLILEMLKVSNLTNENIDLCLKAPFIEFVRMCRNPLVDIFKCMGKSCNVWSTDYYKKLGNFISFLQNFKMVSFLHILSPLRKNIVQLDEALRLFSPEMEFTTIIIPSIMRDFQYEKENFHKYFSNAIQEINKPNNYEFTATSITEYMTVIDHLENEIILRFSNLDSLSFCSLINSNTVNISQQDFSSVYSKLPNVPKLNFNSQQLRDELKMQLEYNILENKNAYDLLHFFECSNYDFPCTKKLLEFSLTIPFKPPTQDGGSSMFQKLKTLSYSACTVESGDASVLYAEPNFLQDLQSDVFNCCVLINFYKINKCIQF